MYKITRQDAAEILNVSTRSIDRYIKSGKLRAQKEGKIIYIHREDIETLSGWWDSRQEVIIPKQKAKVEEKTTHTSSSVSHSSSKEASTLEKIYLDLRSEIQKKDALIQNLSLQLWESKEIAKNSIGLIEFKKSQFLLEESKSHLNKEIEDIQDKKDELEKELKYEKSTNYILIAFIIILFFALGFIWFVKI